MAPLKFCRARHAQGGAVFTGRVVAALSGIQRAASLLTTDSTFTGSTFVRNTAVSGNGGAVFVNGRATFTNCTAVLNNAGVNGGGETPLAAAANHSPVLSALLRWRDF